MKYAGGNKGQRFRRKSVRDLGRAVARWAEGPVRYRSPGGMGGHGVTTGPLGHASLPGHF